MRNIKYLVARRKGFLRDKAHLAYLERLENLIIANPDVFEPEQLAVVKAKEMFIAGRMAHREHN